MGHSCLKQLDHHRRVPGCVSDSFHQFSRGDEQYAGHQSTNACYEDNVVVKFPLGPLRMHRQGEPDHEDTNDGADKTEMKTATCDYSYPEMGFVRGH
jgi:hypothetical protein